MQADVMARNTHCSCRVPLDEAAVPTFALNSEVFQWLADRGVTDIGPDHRGRTSIPVADAMRLYAESAEQAAISEASRARAALAEEERLAKLSARRQEVYQTELYAAAARGVGSARAMQAAREAVDRVEANLDLSTRTRLGPYTWDQGRLSHALLAGLQNQQDAANQREADQAREASAM
jgi:hypothetical protein